MEMYMQTSTYTPGYSAPVLTFMKQRTAEIHAAFFAPHLKKGCRLLDAGCGPGSITLGLARQVAPGQVIGIDIEESQFAIAREQAQQESLPVEFQKASIYALPFASASFDAVFSHAVFQHLADPVLALIELNRVLKPGGIIGIRAADSGGILLDADSDGPTEGLAAYFANRANDGVDPNVGRKLGRLLRTAGFKVQQITASYEVISDLIKKLGPALAASCCPSCSLEGGDNPDDSLFVALAWCEAIGIRMPL